HLWSSFSDCVKQGSPTKESGFLSVRSSESVKQSTSSPPEPPPLGRSPPAPPPALAPPVPPLPATPGPASSTLGRADGDSEQDANTRPAIQIIVHLKANPNSHLAQSATQQDLAAED